MGYCVDMGVDCVIPARNIPAALDAINELHKKGCSWVDSPPEGGWTNIEEAVIGWRYSGRYEDDGGYILDCFEGEKLGDDEDFFRTIAPFAEHLEVWCVGEDGSHWKWAKGSDGGLVELQGVVHYEEPGKVQETNEDPATPTVVSCLRTMVDYLVEVHAEDNGELVSAHGGEAPKQGLWPEGCSYCRAIVDSLTVIDDGPRLKLLLELDYGGE